MSHTRRYLAIAAVVAVVGYAVALAQTPPSQSGASGMSMMQHHGQGMMPKGGQPAAMHGAASSPLIRTLPLFLG